MSPGREQTDAQRAVTRARQATSRARIAAATRAQRDTLVRDTFAIPVRECVYRCFGRPVSVLRAGCLTPIEELGLDHLRESGFEITVVTVDEDSPHLAAESWTAAGQAMTGQVILGDLRAAAIPPRSFDIVHCALLLDRISHVDLVLDRFAAALRPGGLFLLRIRDRDCAAGFLDRMAPQWARRALWTRLYPGRPGPFPAVYERTASDRGIQAFMQTRGLIVAQRETTRSRPAGSGRAGRAVSAARGLAARLTGDRLTDAHDEVLYVIRKLQDRSARIV